MFKWTLEWHSKKFYKKHCLSYQGVNTRVSRKFSCNWCFIHILILIWVYIQARLTSWFCCSELCNENQGYSIKQYVPILSLQNVFSQKLVLTLWLLLWTCAFVHNLCELGWYLGELQFKSILWYNLPVDSLSNVQNCTTALIIWLRGLTSPNAVCWCQTDYKEQKRFGGLVKELGEERCKTPQKISNHLNFQLS